MEDPLEREDVDAILSGIFDINATLATIDDNLQRIVAWLENGGDDEEEAEDPPLS